MIEALFLLALVPAGLAAVLCRAPPAAVLDVAVFEAVRALGLEAGFDQPWPATGRLDGVRVDLEVAVTPEGRRMVLAILDPLEVPFRFGPEGILSTDDLHLGEARFDDTVELRARDDLAARAVFDAETRDAVLGAVSAGSRFEEGRLTLRSDPTTVGDAVRDVRAAVRAHLAIRARLPVLADPFPALRALARADRHATVRLLALDALLRQDKADRETLEDCAADVDVDVCLAAAAALGRDGRDTLARVARTGSRTARVRAAGLLAAGEALVEGHQLAVEDALLAALDDPELAVPALLGLARAGSARSVQPLRAIGRTRGGHVAELARAALAAVRGRLDPRAAGALSVVHGAGAVRRFPSSGRGAG